ncbi:MAG: DNA (cytosine-5-)-methyltransferase [Acidobacteria bacterium]|nr:MAG: DNA (cytosine-5-)-methyltransferase [Acidobacteriota bacterium]REJ98180.1 MAG: DNA (cytosine-5-)-methyltransferase [Acidobacteriota bacterium]REK16923.1 MAG: DNA (cytosine-5-)-methyltransferase [Acidobacteriota bacterium]REK42834.1 MAG: DNA (cytosine-5-)-methyltransferase [Acidobacteriota bacterium]
MGKTLPVVDIFAGPGGLGEGFAQCTNSDGSHPFEIVLSIEKDLVAHRTLQLRSFLHSFGKDGFPPEYYSFLRGDRLSLNELFALYPQNHELALDVTQRPIELGKEDPSFIDALIVKALRRANSKHWILIGGPPCQAYSVIGRSRMTGVGYLEMKNEKHRRRLRRDNAKKFSMDLRHKLYKEYLRIVAIHKPSVFVMENVKGILSSRLDNDYAIERILCDLVAPYEALAAELSSGYTSLLDKNLKYKIYSFTSPDFSLERPKDLLIRCEDYGIPQKRHRVLILGIREDLEMFPRLLEPSPTRSIGDAIGNLPQLRSRISRGNDNFERWTRTIRETRTELRELGPELRNALETYEKEIIKKDYWGGSFVETEELRKIEGTLGKFLYDSKIGGVVQHEARSHMASDLKRYFYLAVFAKLKGRTQSLGADFPKVLLPHHSNLEHLQNGKPNRPTTFADRFRVQVADEPASTITSHISKDGHYYIHFDPTQCRSLTVREAARIQTFPDNYYFEGSRTQQYHQIGNAVPPFLSKQISEVVGELFH